MNQDSELLEIGSSLDQPIPFETKLLDKVDEIIDKSIQAEDITLAIDSAKSMIGLVRLSGLTLAKLLYKIKINWAKFYIEDEFVDYIHNELGLFGITVTRYCRVWELLFESKDISPEIADKLKNRPMRDLVSVSSALAQNYEISEDDWEKLANAPDSSTIQDTLRQVKNVEPRSNALVLKLKRNGDIICWKDGQPYFLGYLAIDKEEDVVKAALDRIISASGILRE